MTNASRQRLLRLLERPGADLAEAALLCCAETDPDLDVDGALLRVDALADGLRSQGFRAGEPVATARALAAYLAGEQGFTGDQVTYHDPDNGLLTRVLDRKRGLPITLSVLYVAIARRLHVAAYPVALPGHVVVAIARDHLPVILDPFHGGAVLDEAEVAARVAEATGGRITYQRAMLRPASSAVIVRRILDNLTRDLLAAQRTRDALWTVELKLLLPNRAVRDHRVHGEVLQALGQFDTAADAFERYLTASVPDDPQAEEVRRAAVAARAQLN